MIQNLVGRPVTVAMIGLAILLLGSISAQRTPIQLMPHAPVSNVTVLTKYPGATPIEVEESVTSPLEKNLATLPGLKSTSSQSGEERSQILLVLDPSVDQVEVMSQLRDRLDMTSLPEGTTKPAIIRTALNSAPITVLNFWNDGGNKELLELAQEIRSTLVPRLEAISGVALVRVSGVPIESLNVQLSTDATLALGIGPQQVADLIRGKGRSTAAGVVSEMDRKIPIRIMDPLNSIDEIKRMVVKTTEKGNVLLGDVSAISMEVVSPEVRSRLNLKDVITIEIYKEADANTVTVGEKIRKVTEPYINRSETRKYQGRLIQDRALEIQNAVSEVQGAVISGAVLAGLIIFILLQAWWPSFVITVTIPLSIFLTFSFMYFYGVTFNLMSLSGLALGVGMLVDNSTVVLESINSHYATMKDRHAASIVGTQNVFGAICGSTFATIAVFAPLVFVEGRIGVLFHDVSLTICFSLISSLIVALTVIPALSASKLADLQISKYTVAPLKSAWDLNIRLLASLRLPLVSQYVQFLSILANWLVSMAIWATHRSVQGLLRMLHLIAGDLLEKIFHGIRHSLTLFESTLRANLVHLKNHDRTVIRVFVALILSGTLLIQLRGGELFPQEGTRDIKIELELPPGTRKARTEDMIGRLEKTLGSLSEIKDIIATIGDNGESTGTIALTGFGKVNKDLIEKIENLLQKEPELRFRLSKGNTEGEGKPVQILVFSENLESLNTGAMRVMELLKEIPGLRNLEASVKPAIQQTAIQIDPNRSNLVGVETSAVTQSLRAKLLAAEIGAAQIGHQSLRIRISPSRDLVQGAKDLESFYLDSENGQKRIYLGSIGEIKSETTAGMIHHTNRKRMARIMADIENIDLAQANKDIRRVLRGHALLPWETAGQESERVESVRQLLWALVLSIVIVFLLLASQFESLMLPLVVLAAAPLSLIGVGLALSIWQLNLSAFVLVGLVILVGSSVNTSIVMVDLANQLRTKGRSWGDAILEATVLRCRPIMITTLSNLLGLVPLVVDFGSSGSSTQKPMAVTLIGGLITSTVLTLFMVPTFYRKLGLIASKSKVGIGTT